MIRIDRSAGKEIVIALSGRLDAETIREVAAVLAAQHPGSSVAVDLEDVVLVDRHAVGFLRVCETQGIELRNCPFYVRTWIGGDSEKD
jgi:ABC-type transporter Mla MlaB component